MAGCWEGGAYETDIDTGDAATAVVLDGRDHLVDDLRGVRLGACHDLQLVRPALGILASHALKSHVGSAAVTHLLEFRCDARPAWQFREVNRLEPWLLGLAEIEAPGTVAAVDENNPRCAVHEGHVPCHLSNRSGAPHGYNIAFFDSSIHDTVPRRRQHIRKIQRLLIRHIIRYFQQVDVPKRHARVLRLTTCESAREMRVAEHASRSAAVHGVLDSVGVRALALRRLLFLAVVALAAGDLEGGDNAVTGLPFGDGGADGVDFAAELVA